MEITPAPVKKRVLIAGGGPGGLYAAYTAARRGHDVLLCEKEDRVGGILKSEEVLPFKQEMFKLGETYRLLAERAGAKIITGQEVTKEFAEAYKPDAIIIKAIQSLRFTLFRTKTIRTGIPDTTCPFSFWIRFASTESRYLERPGRLRLMA